MGNTLEDPVLSMLVRQLAALEEKHSKLEERCKMLEALKSAKATSDVEPSASVPAESAAQESTVPDGIIDSGEKKSAPSRVKVISIRRDADGQVIETEEELTGTKKADRSQHAFILTKVSTSRVGHHAEIDIVDDNLWNLLKEHLRWYPYHIFSDSPTTLYSPFEPIVYQWDVLLGETFKEGTTGRDKQARDDLKLLLDTISGGSAGDAYLDSYFRARENYKNSQALETIQFRDLWTLFPPGTLVYGKPFLNEGQVFVVKDNFRCWPRQKSDSREFDTWSLDAWSWDWEGGSFVRGCYTLSFEPFDGHRPVTTLPYYPFEKHGDYESVRSKLIERGKLFQQYCNVKNESRMFSYKGNAIIEMKGFSGMISDEGNLSDSHSSSEYSSSLVETSPVSTRVDGRVMVDSASFHQYGSTTVRMGLLEKDDVGLDCICSDCQANEGLSKRYRTHFDRGDIGKVWEDEQYLLCPPRVLGYILGKKQWAQLQLTSLQEIPVDDKQDAWNSRLILAKEETKSLLFDLVRCHVSSEIEDDDGQSPLSVNDIVPGKGKGLVILLYGPPGVGKSSTAETIAIAARKPLFSISVADVGTKAKNVEANLSKIFSLATYWKAILLIDEADVFLESRGRGGIVQSTDKNALVSVFLRVLEYYQGIMFLTTNQIAEFDIAIPSRIHIAIQYESLRSEQMEAIFKGFLDNLYKNDLIDDYEGILDWLKEDVYPEGLDGRQIRNIITTALDLANADATYRKEPCKLKKAHLKKTFSNTKMFKRDYWKKMDRYLESQKHIKV